MGGVGLFLLLSDHRQSYHTSISLNTMRTYFFDVEGS